ncbi:MAG: BCAM0308 family protein [Candidatus Bipolaricaulota bacterium]
MVEEQRGNVGHESKNPYNEGRKYPQPTYCSRCGLIYSAGRWVHGELEDKQDANQELCPACRREKDKVPEGLVYLSGNYLEKHSEEILNIAKNREETAQSTRPLQRIMWVDRDDGSVEIATTSEHLARRIGKAVNRAHKGQLDIKSAPNDRLVRVYWQRDFNEDN